MNKLNKHLLGVLLFALPQICFSQFTITGKVTDSETAHPLQYASVYLSASSIGTITNSDGDFSLTVPESERNDTINVSMIGYASYHQMMAALNHSGVINIKLTTKIINLEEVVILEKKLTAGNIVAKALESIPNNFPTETYLMNGFYREMHLENDRAVEFTEAAIDIYDNGYKNYPGERPRMNEKVNLKQVRASADYRHQSFDKSAVQNYNLIVGALLHNPVRYKPFDVNQWMNGKTFNIDTIMLLNNQPIYIISFFTYLPEYPNFERKNILSIDAENYAIYRYSWEEYAKQGKYSEKPAKLSKGFISNRKRISTVYEYELHNGKMYLKYFDEKCWNDIQDAKSKSVVLESLAHVTLVIGNIETENIKMISNETLRRDQSLAAQSSSYDPKFWNDYQQVKILPLTKKNLLDIQRDIPLDKQFEMEASNSKHRSQIKKH